MYGVTRLDRFRNKYIRKYMKILPVIEVNVQLT